MSTVSNQPEDFPTLQTLPGDDVRQIMWRYSDRFDLQMVVQSARSVARGPVAHLVAEGQRNTHEWTPEKASLLQVMDDAGLTALTADPAYGGYMGGPKNLALALVAYELSWVDAGAATGSLASNLGIAPIHERGTEEQRQKYISWTVPQPGRPVGRAAFALTEPIPYVGIDTNTLNGKVRVAEWKEGEEPTLQVDKRGRFITGMAFANFVTAAVGSDDERIKGSCMVILEETDPGVFDRGTATKKLVHQLSSTADPIFSLRVPASRIVGGYTVQDGVIVPNYSHSEVIEAVFRRTRVTVGIMTSAKLLSAIEPVIRYHRNRFRGGEGVQPGTLRFEQGIQQREDALHRLVDVWAIGEAASSLGFFTARLFDEFDPIEREKDALFAAKGIKGPLAARKLFKTVQAEAEEYIELLATPASERDQARFDELQANTLVRFLVMDAEAQVVCPATKLWNTGVGSNAMREAVSLMGGYGITEDCPGFLCSKWMDTQLEATYEGPEAVQRRQLVLTMTHDLFLKQAETWVDGLKRVASERPETGAGTVAGALDLWLHTLKHLQKAKDANGVTLYHGSRQGVSFPMADALCWALAARQFVLDVVELAEKGPENPALAEGLAGTVQFMSDLSFVMAARAAGEVGRVCSELVYGYNASAETCDGLDGFQQLRAKLDACLAGSRLAKDRAGRSLTTVMIPEALDYPL